MAVLNLLDTSLIGNDSHEGIRELTPYDKSLILLQALRADLQPVQVKSSAAHELGFQHGDRPRLWVSPDSFVVIEPVFLLYRFMTERQDSQSTVYVSESRSQMAKFVWDYRNQQKFERENQLSRLFQLRDQTKRQHRWPSLLAAWAFGSLFGALAILTFR